MKVNCIEIFVMKEQEDIVLNEGTQLETETKFRNKFTNTYRYVDIKDIKDKKAKEDEIGEIGGKLI
jgi:hypothetical protein